MLAVKDALKVYLPIALLVGAVFFVTVRFLDPAPPRHVRMATGAPEGAYAAAGERYREIFRRHGVTLELVNTAGSIENLNRLVAPPPSGVHFAFVQGGTGSPEKSPGLDGLASVFLEPLWVFVRSGVPAARLVELRGRRIAVGAEGSGTRAIALELLGANGVTADNTTLLPLGGARATDALLGRTADAAFFVTARPLPLLAPLVASPDVRLLGFERGEAYARRYRYLSRLTLPEGVIDLAANRPARDVALVAPAASLVARADLHPAIVDLVMLAALETHRGGDTWSPPGQFPSQQHLDFPASEEAGRFLRAGPSFLQRHLPFWAAATVQRVTLLLLPLLTLALPLIRIGPATYRWQIRRRIYRHYRELRAIEIRARAAAGPEAWEVVQQDLDRLENQLRRLQVPPGYADGLYHIQAHLDFVRARLQRETRRPAPP
jgi:TRAP transporter TAXI family solute receptor